MDFSPGFCYNDGMEIQEQTKQRGRGPLAEAGIAYSLAALLSLFVPFFIVMILSAAMGTSYSGKDWFKYLSFLLPQVSLAAVSIVYFHRSGVSPRRTYQSGRWHYFPIAVLMQFGLLFSLSELNALFIRLLELMGYQPTMSENIPSLEGWNLLPALLVIAVLPALFEETVFRGILSGSMQMSGWGTASTVLISGGMFALFHGNPEQTIYQFLCGMSFTLIACRAGSILPGMLAHLLNNAAILVLTSLGLGDLGAVLSTGGYIALCAVSGVCLVAALVYLLVVDRKKNERGGVKEGKTFFLMAAVGIGICALEWIFAFVEGCL